MIFCDKCGIDLEKDVITCPLCGYSEGSVSEEPVEKSALYPSDIIRLHRKENRRHLWELTGIIAFSAVAVCTIVDFETTKTLSWSTFADTSIIAAWISLSLLLLYKKTLVIIPGLFITVLSLLLLFDLFDGQVNWFLKIGLPVTLAFFFFLGLILVFWNVVKLKGLNILAFAFLMLSLFCIVTETAIDNYMHSAIHIRWSAIVAVSILPLSLILLFVHYRMKKGKRLESFLHV